LAGLGIFCRGTFSAAALAQLRAHAAIYAAWSVENGFLYVADASIKDFHRHSRVLVVILAILVQGKHW
jgi:hypothetical protein